MGFYVSLGRVDPGLQPLVWGSDSKFRVQGFGYPYITFLAPVYPHTALYPYTYTLAIHP